MTRSTRVALVLLAVLSFSLSAALVAASGRWLRTPAAAVAAAVVRASTRAALPYVGAISSVSSDCTPGAACQLVSHGFSTLSDEENGLGLALIEPGDGDNTMTIDLDGHPPDVEQLMRNDRRPLLWFVRDGEEWESRDDQVIAKAHIILEPLRKLDREMGEVGSQMGAQGSAQGRWGRQMGRVGARLGSLSARRALEAQDAAERDRLEDEIAQARAEMKRLSAGMAAERSHGNMSELGERMRELSRQHRDMVREARPRMRALIEEAVRDHRAERLGSEV